MTLYFPGIGNSAYVATKVGKTIGDKAANLFEKLQNRDFFDVHWFVHAKKFCVTDAYISCGKEIQ